MKRSSIAALVFLACFMFLQGCAEPLDTSTGEGTDQPEISADASVSESAEQSEISMDDLNLVNEYIKSMGAEEITLASAQGLNDIIRENEDTHEKRTSWQLVVDFVRNEQSEEPQELDYSLEFKYSSFSLLGSNWNPVDYQPE